MIKKRINVFNKHKSKYYGKEIFDNLNSIRKYFIDMIKDEIIPKIENDIDFIIKKGWADNVSSSDLYHCHILINHRINHNEDELKKASNYRILYHSRELQKETKDRNIISSLNKEPFTNNSKPSLNPNDLDSIQVCQINFFNNESDLKSSSSNIKKVIKNGFFKKRKYIYGLIIDF